MRHILLLSLALLFATSALADGVKSRNPKAVYRQDTAEALTAAKSRVGLHSTAPLTSEGSPKVPVILVQFPDLRFTAGLADGSQCETDEQADSVNATYNLFCNGLDNGSHYTALGSGGAVKEYFSDQSNTLFTPDFVIIGPVTLDSSYVYYGKNSSTRTDVNLSSFYSEALTKAQAVYTTWDDFDNDSNSTVDMAFFIFAGEGENGLDPDTDPDAENHIWPSERGSGGTINGVSYGAYACTNELYEGIIDGIGVFVHELSHALGLPDLYDTGYVLFGMDYWDVMDSGCYCGDGYAPCNYSAYERDFMGWQSLITLSADSAQQITLDPISSNGDGYKMVNPENEDEYYVIENRQNKGWDTYIGHGNSNYKMHGLLVTHIDYIQSRWTGNTVNYYSYSHPCCTILPADGSLLSSVDVDFSDNDSYTKYLLSMQGDPFPGYADVDSLAGDMATVYTTTGDTPGLMNQGLYDITENDNLTITLTYTLASTSETDAIVSLRADDNTHNADNRIYTLSGVCLGTDATNIPAGIYLRGRQKILVR